MVALADYRQRHAQYKADPDSQEVHRQHPFIVVWDDHELTNNAWFGGAENHDPDQGEGDWFVRRNAAVQAFFEWMPIREDARALSPRIYRTLKFGDLADLILLDTRLVGRDEQAATREDIAAIESPTRSLLGRAQEGWLHGELMESKRGGTRWQNPWAASDVRPAIRAWQAHEQSRLVGRVSHQPGPCVQFGRGSKDR